MLALLGCIASVIAPAGSDRSELSAFSAGFCLHSLSDAGPGARTVGAERQRAAAVRCAQSDPSARRQEGDTGADGTGREGGRVEGGGADAQRGRSDWKARQQKPSTKVDRRVSLRAVAGRLGPGEGESVGSTSGWAPRLADVRVAIVGTKRSTTVGMVARACAAFEVAELILVAPRCDGLAKSALRASKGALQHSRGAGLRALELPSIATAVADAEVLSSLKFFHLDPLQSSSH